jgi:hypothetical protein
LPINDSVDAIGIALAAFQGVRNQIDRVKDERS